MARDDPSLVARLAAECFGTYMLVFTVFCNVLGGTSSAFAALSIGSVLMVLIYSLGDTSGAHLNPAVTVAVSLAQQQKWKTSGYYIAAQFIGGILAGMTANAIFGSTFELIPAHGYSYLQAGVCEALFTLMLCFVVLNTACSRSSAGTQYFGLAIGYVILAGGFASGGISGANLNPAVSLAIDISSGRVPRWSLAYTGFQLLGASLATLCYKLVRPEDFGMSKTGTSEKLVSEFMGAFFLTLTAALNISNGSLAAALSIGAALLSMVYSLGNVSGAHFNPAVTLAVWLSGRNKISGKDGIQYVFLQLLGAILAAFAAAGVCGGRTSGVVPALKYGWIEVFQGEFLFTFVLAFVVLATATVSQKPPKDFFGLCIGSCVTVGGFAGSVLGAGVLNPAVAVGFDAAHSVLNSSKFGNSAGYACFQLGGAAAASFIFKQIHKSEYVG
jgi:aquaporin Z